uniref:Protein ENHANCED DISEASE RESISTANCE 2 C-terminal domain-containing protein n=2 Tax=Chenopodium quinoa TaxID=63459 RepID=A0A803M5Y1_CHEQI
MAKHDDNDEPEWIRRILSEGAVPLLEPDNCPNGWASPSGDIFKVRGPEYFTTKVKVPAGEYLLKPLGFDWVKSSSKISEVLKDPNNRIRKVLDNEFPEGNRPFVWAFNLQLPSKENYSAIAYFVSTEPFVEGSLIDQFIKGGDGLRNSRLKLIANIVKGPWLVRTAVGEQAICVIGRALSCKYCVGENFLEVDIDVGSSVVANAIVHLAFGYITSLTVDLAFLIESQTDTELPERILGAFRFSELNPDSAQSFEASSVAIPITSSTTPGISFWKSLGQGFTNLLHPGASEAGAVVDTQVNGTSDHADNVENTKNTGNIMLYHLVETLTSKLLVADEPGSFGDFKHIIMLRTVVNDLHDCNKDSTFSLSLFVLHADSFS